MGEHEDNGFALFAPIMAVRKKSKVEMAIVDLVRKKRIELDMTQAEIAAHLNTHRSYINMVENPEYHQKYSFDQLNILAEAMECSLKDFMPTNSIPVKYAKAQRKKSPKKKKS